MLNDLIGKKFYNINIEKKNNRSTLKVHWNSKTSPTEGHDPETYRQLYTLTFAQDKSISQLTCFTEVHIGDLLLRAHPSYRSGIRWFDWVYIKWDGYDSTFPAKILMFFIASSKTKSTWKADDIMVLIQSTSSLDDRIPQEMRNRLISKYYKYEKNLQIVPITTIDAPAFVIENTHCSQDGKKTVCDNVIVVEPIDEWCQHYNNIDSKYHSGTDNE